METGMKSYIKTTKYESGHLKTIEFRLSWEVLVAVGVAVIFWSFI